MMAATRPPTKEELDEVFQGVPPFSPTKEDMQSMADIEAEKETESQRIIPKPHFRIES